MTGPQPSRLLLASIAAIAFAVSGCGPGYAPVPVSGKVTYDGQPAAGWHVSFQPVRQGDQDVNIGPGSFATCDLAGRYELELVDPPLAGAIVGPHRVRFTPPPRANAPASDISVVESIRIPEKYRDGSFRFEVPPGGTEAADFVIPRR